MFNTTKNINLNQNQSKEFHFCVPVKLRENYEIKEFPSKTEDIEYIITIYDRYYKTNQSAYNLIRSIELNSDLESIRDDFSLKQNQNYSVDDIIGVINELLVPINIVETLNKIELAKRKSILYVKIPLFSKKFLHPITSVLKYLFVPKIALALGLIIFLFHIFSFIMYTGHVNIFKLVDSPHLFIVTAILSVLSIIFHEFGHSSACRYFGAEHKEIGFGIYFIFPVFYSNVTDIWRLKPMQRVVVDIAGLYFQYIFNVFILVLFYLSHDYNFLYVVVLICIQSVFTINPFFKFDGYWLATDLLQIPNLRKRANEYFKYLISRYVQRKQVHSPVYNVSKVSKYLFYTYSVISNLFFIYFMVFIAKMLPPTIEDLSKLYYQLYAFLVSNSIHHNWTEFGLNLYKFVFRIFLLGVSAYFAFRIIKPFLKKIKLVIPNR